MISKKKADAVEDVPVAAKKPKELALTLAGAWANAAMHSVLLQPSSSA
jgi:hypothetical protein